MVASHTPPNWDLACNPGMCPDWESNQRSDPLLHRPALSPLSHTSQGQIYFCTFVFQPVISYFYKDPWFLLIGVVFQDNWCTKGAYY